MASTSRRFLISCECIWVWTTKVTPVIVKILSVGRRKPFAHCSFCQNIGSNTQRFATHTVGFLDHIGANQRCWIDRKDNVIWVVLRQSV